MRALAMIVVVVLGCAVVAACTQADAVCNLVCECEHCNDVRAEYECASWNNRQEVADVYGCGIELEDYLTCIEENGRCDEEESDFTTRAPGSCSESFDLGVNCMVDSDCPQVGGSTTCQEGRCRYPSCAGSQGNVPCDDDSDCENGADLCGAQQLELAECFASGSDDPSLVVGAPIGID
jgi:hypothetical protein